MTLLLNFITAIAWIWGTAALVVGVIWANIPDRDYVAAKRCVFMFFAVLPAWAWLIARYLL